MTNPNRHPEGTSVGGQWAPGASGEVDDAFDDDQPMQLPPGVDRRVEKGEHIQTMKPGELVEVGDGAAYVLGGSRGVVVAMPTRLGGGSVVAREYVYARQSFPGAAGDPAVAIAWTTTEGTSVNRSHDANTPGMNGSATNVGSDPRAALAAVASYHIGTSDSSKSEAQAFADAGAGPGRLPEGPGREAALERMGGDPAMRPMPPLGQESGSGIEDLSGELRSLYGKSDRDRVFAYTEEGSQVTFYVAREDGSIGSRSTS